MSIVSDAHPSFFVRLWLAFACLARVLFDAEFARRILELRGGHRELPASDSGLPEERHAAELEAPGRAAEPAVAPAAEIGALQVIALLQREGRLIDFVQQDITPFPDAEIGAAARVVHQGCRKALTSLVQVAAVRAEPEGAAITLGSGVDHGSIKLVGDVQGPGPYRGVLRHRGWRAEGLSLPEFVGDYDPRVLAPAEVEL
jgi:hypothetical protein